MANGTGRTKEAAMQIITVYIDPRHEARWYGTKENSSPTPETVPAQGAEHKQEQYQ